MNLAQFSRSMTFSKVQPTNAASHDTGTKLLKKSVSDSKLIRRIKSITRLGTSVPHAIQLQEPVDLTEQADHKEQTMPKDIGQNEESQRIPQVSKSWKGQARSSGSLVPAQGTKPSYFPEGIRVPMSKIVDIFSSSSIFWKWICTGSQRKWSKRDNIVGSWHVCV